MTFEDFRRKIREKSGELLEEMEERQHWETKTLADWWESFSQDLEEKLEEG